MEIDHNNERRFEDEKDLKEAADRERRGVVICPTCDQETATVHDCGNPDCEGRGCSECMHYDDQYCEWHCDYRCIIERLGKAYDALKEREFRLKQAINAVLNSNWDAFVIREHLKRVMESLTT